MIVYRMDLQTLYLARKKYFKLECNYHFYVGFPPPDTLKKHNILIISQLE